MTSERRQNQEKRIVDRNLNVSPTAMFRRWSSTDADRSGNTCRHDKPTHKKTKTIIRHSLNETVSPPPHRRWHTSVPSSYVIAIGAILFLSIGAPPSGCHAKQHGSKTKSALDTSKWATNTTSLHQRQPASPRSGATMTPSGANNVQETKWPPISASSDEEEALDLTNHNQRRRHHQRHQTAANRTATTTTTTSLYDRMAAAAAARERRGRQRGGADAPKRTMPHYLAILSGEEVAPATSTRWREVNDSAPAAGSGMVRPPRLHPLRPPKHQAVSAEDYFGGDDDEDETEDESDDDDVDLDMRPTGSSRGTSRGSQRDAVLKSSKDALIVTKKSYLKKDWCKTEPLVQRVREAGCLTRTIVNRFCYGQCNSFYIPKNTRQEVDANAFKSCSFCKPKRFTWITITLRCPGRQPPYKRKRIQRIKKCKCISEILQ